MYRNALISLLLVMLMVAPVMAGHCPMDAKAIDSALENTSLSDADKAEVMSLRDKGMELHNSGDHRASEKTLAQAMRMLLLAE